MRSAYLFPLLICLSVVTFSQQPQQLPSDAERSSAGAAQAERPYLHGDSMPSLPLAQVQSAAPSGDLHGQLQSLKSYLGTRRGLIEIPPNAAAGWWEGTLTSNLRVIDDRGNSLPDTLGRNSSHLTNGYKTGLNNALLFRATETDPSSPEIYSSFANAQFHYDAAKGGQYNFNGKTGVKTDYFNILASSEMRTVGQKSGISSFLASFSSGDTMGIQTGITQYGGYDETGDEQTEGIRVQIQQGSAGATDTGGVFKGVTNAIEGTTLTYSATRDENTLGEHRVIRDLDRVYSTGSIASIVNSGGSPNTVKVTGSGTRWSELGLHEHTQWNNLASGGGVIRTNLAFCFDPIKSEGYDMCFPVSEIIDDTHLTLNLLAMGTAYNTHWPAAWPGAGPYHIYGAAWPTSVDLAAHTISASDMSGISRGHRIDQVLPYNMQSIGEWICMSRHTGMPGTGAGMVIWNWGTAQSPEMGYGIGISGAFDSAIDFQDSNQRSGVPNYFTRFLNEPKSKFIFDSTVARDPAAKVALWQIKDASGAAHAMLSFLRETATTCVLDNSLCVSPTGAVTVKKLDQVEPGDYAGVIDMEGRASVTISFKQPFQAAPVCTLTPTVDPSSAGAYWVSSSSSSITANVKQAGRISFNYICVGNPN